MVFDLCKGLYVGKLKFASRKKNCFDAVIDTGAVHSFLTTGYLEEVMPGCTKYAKRCLTCKSTAKMADGSPVSVSPIVLRNVNICGLDLPEFKCLLGVTNYRQCLLGTDFITAGNWTISHSSLELVSFSADKYADNLHRYYMCEVTELNALVGVQPTDEQLQWCHVNAPDALKGVPDTVLWNFMSDAYFENN